jgi:hypothetical protein
MPTNIRLAAIGSMAVIAVLTMRGESRAAERLLIRTYNNYGVSTDAMTATG